MITSLTYVVSRFCNLSCPFCLSSSSNVDIADEIPIDNVIRFIAKLGSVTNVKITGGEPLSPSVLKKTLTLLEYCTGSCIEMQINTNGTFTLPDVRRNVSFQVSLDGMRATHDKLRGVGVFDKASDFIRKALNKGFKVHTMSVIQSENVNEIDALLDYTKNVLHVEPRFQIVSLVGRGIDAHADFDKQKVIRYLSSNRLYGSSDCRPLVKICHTNLSSPVGHSISIDECGYVIPCPYLKHFRFGTIADFDEKKVRAEMSQALKGVTCSFQSK